MKSLTDKFLAVLVLVFAVLTEWLHTFFGKNVHSYYDREGIITPIYWSDMVYQFVNESLTLLIVGIILIKLTGRGAKAITTSVFAWFLIEWIEILLQMAKIDDSRLIINDGAWLQLSICVFLMFLVLFGTKKLSS